MSLFTRACKTAKTVSVRGLKAVEDDGSALPLKLKRVKGQEMGALPTPDEKGIIAFLAKEKGITMGKAVKGEYFRATPFVVIDGKQLIAAARASDDTETEDSAGASRTSEETASQSV